MPVVPAKILPVMGAALLLAACNTTDRLVDNRPPAVRALASVPPPPDTTGSIGDTRKEPEPVKETTTRPGSEAAVKPMILPGDEIFDEADDAPTATAPVTVSAAGAIAEGRDAYRGSRFKEAERHFRGATQIEPKNSEAWMGLAASADRQRNFKLADMAYGKARGITGTTAEVLNNQGYSYILRGDLKRAREALSTAQRLDPSNKYVENNLALLDSSERKADTKADPKADTKPKR